MRTRFSIECWMRDARGDVLLLHVPSRLSGAVDFWQPVTGGIEPGESAVTAAQREVREETHLHLPASDLRQVADSIVVPIDETLQINKTVFLTELRATAPTVVTAPDEHDKAAWVPASDVPGWLHWPSNHATWQLVAAGE